ncbi:MAG: dockerin type I domain-containing protein, partial [Planctomycetaceae bacterium]|nr:dockerin type I domain-containing protein [Planctomycetaceae bacterium]
DSMPVEISNNGGTSWTLLENITQNNGAWTKRSWRVRDFITPTNNMRVRFVARDLNTGSLVEAGVDDFRVIDVDCTPNNPADLNGDGAVNGADLTILLGAWGSTNAAYDLDGSGTVSGGDLAILLGAWG